MKTPAIAVTALGSASGCSRAAKALCSIVNWSNISSRWRSRDAIRNRWRKNPSPSSAASAPGCRPTPKRYAVKGSTKGSSARSRSPRRPRCVCSRPGSGGSPLLSSWEPLGDYLQAAMGHAAIEEVRVLLLNAKKMLIANESLWTGSVDEASVHVREVIARAIALGATALIIVHNHPSGDPAPSRQDIVPTKELIDAGRHMKIAVHDHVIVGSQGRSSVRAMGLI